MTSRRNSALAFCRPRPRYASAAASTRAEGISGYARQWTAATREGLGSPSPAPSGVDSRQQPRFRLPWARWSGCRRGARPGSCPQPPAAVAPP
eukprot:6595584-Prymnesium_polylepis.1